MEYRMQCYKLNVLCNEVYANASTGTALKKKKRIQIDSIHLTFQKENTTTAAIQAFSFMISRQDVSKKQAFFERNNKYAKIEQYGMDYISL